MSDHIDETLRDDADPGGEVHATGGDCPGCSGGETPTRIIVTRIEDKDRIGFLPRVTEGRNLEFEFGVYDLMRDFCRDYAGGFWEFYSLSNGGFYIAPDEDRRYHIFVPSNGFDGELSSDAAGVVMSLYSLNKMTWRAPTEYLNAKYYELYDFAAQHPEAATIFGAID